MSNYLARVAAAGARVSAPARPPLAAPPILPDARPVAETFAADLELALGESVPDNAGQTVASRTLATPDAPAGEAPSPPAHESGQLAAQPSPPPLGERRPRRDIPPAPPIIQAPRALRRGQEPAPTMEAAPTTGAMWTSDGPPTPRRGGAAPPTVAAPTMDATSTIGAVLGSSGVPAIPHRGEAAAPTTVTASIAGASGTPGQLTLPGAASETPRSANMAGAPNAAVPPLLAKLIEHLEGGSPSIGAGSVGTSEARGARPRPGTEGSPLPAAVAPVGATPIGGVASPPRRGAGGGRAARITIGRLDMHVHNRPPAPPAGRPSSSARTNQPATDTLAQHYLDRFRLRP
jgi:hypothetical protein